MLFNPRLAGCGDFFKESGLNPVEVDVDKKKTAMALALIEDAISLFYDEKGPSLAPIDQDALRHLEDAKKALAALMRDSGKRTSERNSH